jgi:hypothetical protein
VRENRQHGSEGGEATSLPYPYRLGRAKDVDARDVREDALRALGPAMTNSEVLDISRDEVSVSNP